MQKVGWLLTCLVGAISLGAGWASGAEWYASPTGSSTGTGSQASPWDLQTALNGGHPTGAVQHGDTIWLRGGTYSGSFTSTLNGASDNYIKVRQYAGERAIVDSASGSYSALTVSGAYTEYRDFELTNSDPGDTTQSGIWTGNSPGQGIGNKFINLTIHDNPVLGIGYWVSAENAVVYGCVIYYNGTTPNLDHGIYAQNNVPTRKILDCIIIRNMAYGIHVYGSSSAFINNFLVQGNMCALNPGCNILTGGGSPSTGIEVRENCTYGTYPRIGYTAHNLSAIVRDNYFAGDGTVMRVCNWDNLTLRGNTLVSRVSNFYALFLDRSMISSLSGHDWDANTYYFSGSGNHCGYVPLGGAETNLSYANWLSTTGLDASTVYNSSLPTAVRVFVRANQYETGRANIMVYNWPLNDSVSVDVPSVLAVGDQYAIKDAQNYLGPDIASGTYSGGSISIPMTSTAVTAPVHSALGTITHASKEVGIFVLRRTGVSALPVAPTGLAASDGTYDDRVRVTWAASAGATAYKVFRNTINDSASASQIGAPTGTTCDDASAAAGTTYYYWAKAANAAGDSGFSNADSGYAVANRPPTTVDDFVSTAAGVDLVVDVLTNDTDPDGDTLAVVSVTTPGHGGATINSDYTVTYSSDSGYIGADSFAYTVDDGNGATDTATVHINVTSPSYTLSVTSSPIIDVAVGGLTAGMTNYLAHIAPGHSVTLIAPLMVLHSDKVYYFVRWTVGGVAQTDGQASATFDVNADTTATAVYKSVRQIKISGPKRVYERTRARYKCVALYTEGPSEVYTVLAMWRENSPVMKFVGPGVLKFGGVSKNTVRKFTATYGGMTGSFKVTIRNR